MTTKIEVPGRQLRVRQANDKRSSSNLNIPTALSPAKLTKPKSTTTFPSFAAETQLNAMRDLDESNLRDESRTSQQWQDGLDTPNSAEEYDGESLDMNGESRAIELSVSTFVSKLYSLLETEHYKQYLRWTVNNSRKMFTIDQIDAFAAAILPHHFKHCKFASFVRQLNIYGFKRDTDARKYKGSKEKESCRWYHPYFLPGRRDLLNHIRRKAPRFSRRKIRRTMKYEEKDGTLPDSPEFADDSEDEQNSVDWPRTSNFSMASKFGHQDDLVLQLKRRIDELTQTTEKQQRENDRMNRKLAMQNQHMTKLAMFVKAAYPNGDHELQQIIQSCVEYESPSRKMNFTNDRRLSGALNDSNDPADAFTVDSFSRGMTTAAIGSPFPNFHHGPSPNSPVTSTPNSRSPMTPNSEYSLAFGDTEAYTKPSLRPEGPVTIGVDIHQWARTYTDQQQAGASLSHQARHRTDPAQSYASHQNMLAPQQMSFIGHTYQQSHINSVQARPYAAFYPQGVILEQMSHGAQPVSHQDMNVSGYQMI